MLVSIVSKIITCNVQVPAYQATNPTSVPRGEEKKKGVRVGYYLPGYLDKTRNMEVGGAGLALRGGRGGCVI